MGNQLADMDDTSLVEHYRDLQYLPVNPNTAEGDGNNGTLSRNLQRDVPEICNQSRK